MKDLEASASFILRRLGESSFHFEGSGKPKDKSLKASASFIMRKVSFILKAAESPKMKVLKRQRSS